MKIEFIQNCQCKGFLRIGIPSQHYVEEIIELKETEETNVIVADLQKSGFIRRLPGYVKTKKEIENVEK